MSTGPKLGVCFDRSFPATDVAEFARVVEASGLDAMFVIEDSFFDAGVPLAAATAAATERIEVGLGVMPSVTRTVGLMAMSVSTLAQISGGRFVAGLGHGVSSWMEQMGVRPDSPLTCLDEVATELRRLLDGHEVTHKGRYVHLDQVKLQQPPPTPPPLLFGVQGPRSLKLAGTAADGIILVEGVGANYVNWALQQAGRAADEFRVVTYTICVVDEDRECAHAAIAPFIADAVTKETTAMRQLSCFDEMAARVAAHGSDGLLGMAPENWTEFGAIGTIEDAASHVGHLAQAGVDTVCMFPGPRIELGYDAIKVAVEIKALLGAQN